MLSLFEEKIKRIQHMNKQFCIETHISSLIGKTVKMFKITGDHNYSCQ